MDILTIIGLVIGLLILFIIVSFVIIRIDLASYTATGAETLSPTGTTVGNALVVYTPGLSGAAKKAAAEIANELKSKGYTVTLAGVRNAAATNTSDYDIIIAGGPIYGAKVSSSIDTYLKTLTITEKAKLGVFGTTGTGSHQFSNEDLTMLKDQVASLQRGKNATLKLIRDRDEKNATQDYEDFVSAMVQ